MGARDRLTIINVTKKIAFDCNDWTGSVPSYEEINKMAHLMKWDETDKIYGLCSSCCKWRMPCSISIGIVCNNIDKIFEEYNKTDLEKKHLEVIDSTKKYIEANEEYYQQRGDHFPLWIDGKCINCQ
ncbi:MAG: hypothetical protein Terrestrivirus5_13 [Terrestrivirus sp.]|uniref:Uncharacterized protein n=1 Tax=Terrestrivirus sp. TaxID=2487775 RepID=A0A3G4ZQC4_9VIRU|nr:MAG: hypothetical protein Terrestrivirus5_13 [Terrestrivirus sp.]